MSLKVRDKFSNVVRYGFLRRVELQADLCGDLRFGMTLFQKFEDARTNEVQPIDLSMEDVQNHGAILAMRCAELFR